MAVSAAGQRLRETINQLKELAEVSGKATPELQRLEQALEMLYQRSTTAGTSPTKQMVSDVSILLEQVEQYGRGWRLVSENIRGAGLAVQAIARRNMQVGMRGPGQTLATQVTPVLQKPQMVGVTGDLAQVNNLMKNEAVLLENLDAGLVQLAEKYNKMGFELGTVKTQLDSTNAVFEHQLQLIRRLGPETTLAAKATGRTSAATGQMLAPTSLAGELQERLGSPARYQQFTEQLNQMGLSVEHLRDVQIDAVTGMGRFAFRAGEAGKASRTATFHIDRWGRQVGDMSNRFKTFDAMIANNISKVLRWAVAVGLVYGAWSKAQQMFRDMIDIQEAMTDLAIITGRSTDELGDYFTNIADIARETGTDLKDGVGVMAAAMRAAGGESSDTQRTAVALNLVGDSAAYARLSGIEMSQAMDILVSALRQLNMPLGDGDKLLTKWVAVSKVAHTSLLDLGQAFATAAAAAESTGVSVDNLNGLIATMAEVTSLSAQQSANAIRAILSSIQMPSTQEVLEKYGIAIKDASGELRDMEDVLEDINVLITDFGAGAILGEKAISELAYALGGQGARRQAQVIALLKNLNRAQEISNVSSQAQGDLDEALAAKSGTLRSAINELNTSFLELAESLGTDGGVLDVFTGVVNILTEVVDFMNKLTEATGPATSAVIAFTAAWAISTKMALGQRLSMAFGAGRGMDPSLAFMAGGGQGAGLGKMLGGVAPGLAIGAVHGIQAAQGEMEADEAAGRIGGAIAGGIVGNMLLPGAGGMIGAYIGDALAGSTISSLRARQGELTGVAVGELAELEATITRQLAALREGRTAVPVYARAREEEILEERLAELRETIKLRTPVEAGPRGVPEAPSQQRRFLEYQQQFQPALALQFEKRRMELPFEFAAGEIESAREYAATLERMDTISNAILPIFDAMSMGLRYTGEELDNNAEKFEEMALEMSGWSDESVSFILDQALAIVQLNNQVEETGEGYEELSARLKAFPRLYEGLRRTEIAFDFDIPGFKDFAEYTQDEFDEVIAMAQDLQEQFGEQLGIPEEAFDSVERWAALVGENFEWVEGVMEQFVMEAKKDFDEVSKSQEDAFNVKRLKDVDPSKMGEIARANRYWIEYLSRLKGMSAQQYMEMEGQQFNLILGPNNVLQQLNSTNEAMLFALQDIKDIEEKQLEGMWNIPTGATFWVPITSMFYRERGGAGGYPELPELIPPTNRTADATEGTEQGVGSLNSGLDALTQTMRTMITEVSFEPGKAITDLIYELGKLGVKQSVGLGEDVWEDQPDWVKKLYEPYQLPDGGFYSPQAMRDIMSEELFLPAMGKMKGLETEDTGGLMQALQDLFGGLEITFKKYKPPYVEREHMPEIGPTAPEATPVDVSVEIPEISGSFTIENKIMLDGRQIQSYINRMLSQALARISRANARTSTGTMR